ncbi:hypothetical protein OAT18_01215, partial [Tenacibaculum sp.]|nr:hypothetical protein [Tenacibaculum sp.]
INTITSLDLYNSGISNATGIEDFTSLETLSFQSNNLTTLDVSNLTQLTYLNFSDNSISSIDLSVIENLEILVSRLNPLTSLDVSDNVSLQQIHSRDCQITSIDVTNNPDLTIIRLNDNALTSADFRNGTNINLTNVRLQNNANLYCVLVDDVAFAEANFTRDSHTRFGITSCYTAIPDDNFEAALEALGYDDISGDNQVPTALIEVVTTLDVINKNITDLTGIESFTALTDLDCSRNNLTSLNLQYNIALTALNCEKNYSVTTIDVSNNTGLINLDFDNNIVSTIDVSNNILLEGLDIRSNPISILDLSQNTQLTTLACNFTNISSLDLSSNTELTNLKAYKIGVLSSVNLSNTSKLEILDCYDTNLNSLDVSDCTALKTVNVSDNNFTSLDFSSNEFLESVNVLGNDLTYLNMQNQNNGIITAFNATGNSNLTCIQVDDASASYLTSIPWNKDATTDFSEGDYCVYTAIPDTNFEAALEALGYDDVSGDNQVPTALIEVITSLDISSQSISDLTGIEAFIALEDLNIYGNSINSIDISYNANLISMNCRFNGLTALDISANTALSVLIAQDNDITSIDVSNNIALTNLGLARNLLTSLDVSTNTNLEKLYAGENSIVHLDLSNNENLTLVGANVNNLESFNIQNNNNGIITTFVISENPNLTCALVDNATYSTTNWGSIDAQTTFSDTYCDYTAIPDTNFEAALEALGYDDITGDLQVPTALISGVISLDVSGKSITNLTGIEDFTSLEILNIANNFINDLDLSGNTVIEELYCYGPNMLLM